MKYIEIAVPDSFDDSEKTTYDALDCAESISPASTVGRDQLEHTIAQIAGMSYSTQAADIIDQCRVLNRQLKESQARPPIFSSPRSISDDDLCATCQHCDYRPGELSGCQLDWPCQPDEDDYVRACDQFKDQTASV